MTVMLRPYVTDIPAREDLEFQTNSDKPFGVVWLKADGATPVAVTSAVLTLEFDVPAPTEEVPDPVPVRHTINSIDPSDPDGYIDPDGFPLGQVLTLIPSGIWTTLEGRSGNWDVQAVSVDGITRVLVRGIFTVEEGVT